MKDKIREIRAIIPVPLAEAKALLEKYDGDVEKSIAVFKKEAIDRICELVGCDRALAEKYYEQEKFDFNRTVSSIRETIYDRDYRPIDGMTKGNVRVVLQWLGIIAEEDFVASLNFPAMDTVVYTLSLLPSHKDMALLIKQVKDEKERIFDGYTDDMAMDEFVRRHKLLDNVAELQQAQRIVPLKITVLKEELLRHLRNLV